MRKNAKLNLKYDARLCGCELTVDVLLRRSDRNSIQNIVTPDGRLIVRIPNWEYYTEEMLKRTILDKRELIVLNKTSERFKDFVPLTQKDKKELTSRTLDEMLPLIDTFEYKCFAESFDYKAVWSHRFAGCFWGLKELVELNPVMLLMPQEMQRYILAHELAHGMLYLCYSNDRPHGREFFETAERIMPGFQKAHEEFKYYAPLIRAYSYIND